MGMAFLHAWRGIPVRQAPSCLKYHLCSYQGRILGLHPGSIARVRTVASAYSPGTTESNSRTTKPGNSMSELSLVYFDIKGRAEPIRLAMHLGGIPWSDERCGFAGFPRMKQSGRLPLGQLPVLTTPDGVAHTQSLAILRYCGKRAGLYPRDDDRAALEIDEVVDVVADIGNGIFKYTGPDKEKLREARVEFVQNAMPALFGGLEKIVHGKSKSDKWVSGEHISIADLVLYYTVGNILHNNVDHIPPELLDPYPRLITAYEAVLNHPKVKSWNEKHPWKQ